MSEPIPPCDLEGDWQPGDVAKTWPEGSIVLRRDMNARIHEFESLQADTYFRPDWVGEYYGESCWFLLIKRKEI